MIYYRGQKFIGKVPFICFSNEHCEKVEIPIDIMTSKRISSYLDKIGQGKVSDSVEVDESEESSADDL